MMTVTTCRGCSGVVDVARATTAQFQASEDSVGNYFSMLERLLAKLQQPDEVMRKIRGMVEEELPLNLVHFCPVCAETMEKQGFISFSQGYSVIEGGEHGPQQQL